MSGSDEKQREALSSFRERLSDVLEPHHDDYYLMRWLWANYTTEFNLDKSEADLRHHMKWRQQVGADTILTDWTAPEVLQKYYPGGLYGYDKKGRPIWIEPAGYSDVKGLLMSAKKADIIRLKIQHCEQIQQVINSQRAKLGSQVDGLVILFDVEHLGMQHLWKPALNVYTDILTMYERHYPETLRKTYVVNAPAIFPVAYSLVKPFLSEATKKKIVILGRNWKSALLRDIDADQLPVHWGGTAVGPDGDIHCSHSVGMGGKVSPEFFRSASTESANDSLTHAVIDRRSTLSLEFEVKTPNSTLRWHFASEGMDIGFSVLYVSSPGSSPEAVLPMSRVNSHLVPEDGALQCASPGLYIVKFDNHYSVLHSKKIFYSIDVIEPTADDTSSIDKSPQRAV